MADVAFGDSQATAGAPRRGLPVSTRALFLYLVYQPFTGLTFFGLTVALPVMMRDFHVGVATIAWVQLAYGLGLAGSAFAGGSLSRYIPHRTLIVGGIFGDVGLTLLMVWTQDIYAFLALRFLQGLVRIPPWTTLQVMSVGAMPPERRGRALGITGFVQGAGQLAFVPLGAFVTEAWGWRWVLVISAGVLLALGAACCLVLPKSVDASHKAAQRQTFDAAGAALLLVGVVGVLAGLQLLVRGLDAPVALGMLGAGALLLTAYGCVELRAAQPVFQLRLLKVPGIFTGAGTAVFTRWADGAVMLLLPFLFVSGYGWSVAHAGGVMLFLNIARPAAGPAAGWLADRLGNTRVIVPAAVVAVAAQVGIAFWGADPPIASVVAALVAAGLAQQILTTANQRQLFNSVPKEHIHTAPLISLVFGQVGNSAAQAVAAAALGFGAAAAAGVADPRIVDATSRMLLVLAAVFAAGMVAVYAAPRWLPRTSHIHRTPRATEVPSAATSATLGAQSAPTEGDPG